ncbi:hypothetical protein K3495_g7857 [Podosphaera aphanis]|nr:hypothetical protein K3495_g7857 [Podosphaera aphanis]
MSQVTIRSATPLPLPADHPAPLPPPPYTTVPLSRDFIVSSGSPKPQILWVGCSDSLIIETETLDLLPQELFVHRNLGNILSNGDLSSLSAIEWAIGLLGVKHVVICGHYECMLLREPDGDELGGWHRKLTDLCKNNKCNSCGTGNGDSGEAGCKDDRCRVEELHVLAEMGWLRRQPVVMEAMSKRGLQVHGFVYDREKGVCVRLVEKDNSD